MKDRDLRYIPPHYDPYWTKVRLRAKELKSDGCTVVSDFYLDSCLEHDIHWRTGKTLSGYALTERQANMRFRWVIQNRSIFGVWSPMSWGRWVGVSVAGIWHRHVFDP